MGADGSFYHVGSGLGAGTMAAPRVRRGLTLYFTLPLSRALVEGRSRLRDAIAHNLDAPARRVFVDAVAPRARVWVVSWIAYYIGLEWVTFVFGGGNLILSVPSAALVISFTATSLHRLPTASGAVWLALASIGTSTGLIVGIGFAVYTVMATLDLGGYMDIGLLVGPPILGGVILAFGSVVYLVRASYRDDTWYRGLR